MRFLGGVSVVAVALASSGCLTLYGGVRQPIVVNSSPAGAVVSLNGRPVGAAPVEVTVDRGSSPVLRVESPGFEPTVLRPRRRVNRWIAVDLAVGALAFYATGGALLGGREGSLSSPLTALAVLAGAAPTLVDFNSGAAYAFPRRVNAVLRPALHRPPGGRARSSLRPPPIACAVPACDRVLMRLPSPCLRPVLANLTRSSARPRCRATNRRGTLP